MAAFCLLFITACNNCNCTQRSCHCFQLAIRLEANVDNNKAGAFTANELAEFYVVRTDSNYAPIDSIPTNFSLSDSTDYNQVFWIYPDQFPNFLDFTDYNFLIKNAGLNSVDTLSGLVYEAEQKEYLCNECSGGCDDQYLTCYEFSNVFLFHNGVNFEGFSARLKK